MNKLALALLLLLPFAAHSETESTPLAVARIRAFATIKQAELAAQAKIKVAEIKAAAQTRAAEIKAQSKPKATKARTNPTTRRP